MDKRSIIKQLQRDLDTVSFSMDELRLFLDTHPECKEALDYFKSLSEKRENILSKYSQIAQMEGYAASSACDWNWISSPWPWEVC